MDQMVEWIMVYTERGKFIIFKKYLREGERAILRTFFILTSLYVGLSLWILDLESSSMGKGFLVFYESIVYLVFFLLFLFITIFNIRNISRKIDANSLELEENIRVIEKPRKAIVSLILVGLIGIVVIGIIFLSYY